MWNNTFIEKCLVKTMTYLAPVICTQYGKGVLMTPPNDDARLHVPSYFSLTNDVPHSVR